ncbi:MRN complex-interacting protein [Scleropages formosus]|uniref:MRN complex interacting protein n=1 Tax=Scleropages formosus TaxID=113540 RepID=A0A8C9R4G2_SCLFO|nr:MRN complex-interacting protein [Scleropages formosus]
MGQEFHVLRCFSCQTFQVQQVKKSKKWSCKMCGEKQSLIKVYGQGSGADCRRHVQKLNALRGEMVQAEDYLAMTSRQETVTEEDRPAYDGDQQVQECKESCWNKYLYRTDENMPEQVEQENENVYMGRNGFHTQREPPSRKHQRSWAPVPREFDPTETCNHWKRTKKREWEGTHDLQPSMQTSPKSFLPRTTFPVNKSSAASQQFPASEASAETRTQVGDASIFPRSSEREERKTSKWDKFLPHSMHGKAKCEESLGQEATCSGETSAPVNVCHQLQSAAGEGMYFGSKVQRGGSVGGSFRTGQKDLASFHCDAAPVYQHGLSSRHPHTILSALFQTDEDFDI